jgi:hypothetical protein
MHARAAIGAIEEWWSALCRGRWIRCAKEKINKLIDKCMDLITQSSTMITKK